MTRKPDATETYSVTRFKRDDPDRGDYVEIDGKTAIIEEILGGRARVNFGVVGGDDADVDTCSVADIDADSPDPGDFVTIDGERAVVEEILGGRARVNFSVE
ncbi:hypothetical protein [Halorussus amylolyticus]|uniref:hypothetical protein n=1 Tax=Halorussus amylolyticus TaxID=1126242 RepID=UPI001052FADC|nr:hypothetical protein [Halorussus amylolyticus]